jgi:hypothetical protein
MMVLVLYLQIQQVVDIDFLGLMELHSKFFLRMVQGNYFGKMEAWSLVGNSQTNPGTNFIGTTDAQDFVIKTNGIEMGRFYNDSGFIDNSVALGGGVATANDMFVYGKDAGLNGTTNSIATNLIGSNAGGDTIDIKLSNFFGLYAGYNADLAQRSNFLGEFAGTNATQSRYATFIGSLTGAYDLAGSGLGTPNAANSIFIGTSAGYTLADGGLNNTTNPDDFSILLGNVTSTGGFENSIALGQRATNTASNQFMIGSTTRAINETKIIGSLGTECTITTGTGMACTSDERLKTNITDLNSDTLSKLQNVRTVSYNWLQNPDSPLQIGFLAQNLEQYFPEMVMTDATGKKQVYYSQMTPILTKAIQELNLKVDLLSLNTGNTSNDVFGSLKGWLGDVGNGVTDFFAQRGHFKELCIGENGNETCLTKDQVDQLLNQQAASEPIVSIPDFDITDPTTNTETIPELVVDPGLQPEILTGNPTSDPIVTE